VDLLPSHIAPSPVGPDSRVIRVRVGPSLKNCQLLCHCWFLLML